MILVHMRALIHHLIHIINPLIWILCFLANCWNQFPLASSPLKRQCFKVIQKFIITHWKKTHLPVQCKINLSLMNHYQSTRLFYIRFLLLFSFWTNWSNFIMVLSNSLTSLRKSQINFWHKTENYFRHIDINWFPTTTNNFCFFLSFNHTLNKIR